MNSTSGSGPRRALLPVASRPVQATRAGRVTEIVEAALMVLEADGIQALTMRRLADELGLKAPSLYNHLVSRDALLLLLVDDALFVAGDLAHDAVDRAGRAGPVASLLAAYRAFGASRTNLYRLVTGPGPARDGLTPGLEQWAGEPFYRATGEPPLAHALWAYAHGMVMLETDDRFQPSDLDSTWRAAVSAFTVASSS